MFVAQVVRLDQNDPGPEDQRHSNQLGAARLIPSVRRRIAGSINLFSERPWVCTRKSSTIGIAVYDSIRQGSDANRATASIEPLASLIRLSIISSLQTRREEEEDVFKANTVDA